MQLERCLTEACDMLDGADWGPHGAPPDGWRDRATVLRSIASGAVTCSGPPGWETEEIIREQWITEMENQIVELRGMSTNKATP